MKQAEWKNVIRHAYDAIVLQYIIPNDYVLILRASELLLKV